MSKIINRLKKTKDKLDKAKDKIGKAKDKFDKTKDKLGKVKEKVEVVKKVIDTGKNIKDHLDNPKEKNQIKIWPKNVSKVKSWPEDKALKKLGKSNVAVAFSGGGIRAATCALGQIRALNSLKLTTKIKYVGCNSGGSWFTVPWIYLPKKIKEKDYVGSYTDPESLNIKKLRQDFPRGWQKKQAVNCSQALGKLEFANIKTIHNMITSDSKKFNSDQDEKWGRILGEQLLKPFGLYHDVNKYACYTTETRDEILKRNRHLRKSDFLCVRSSDRPFLLVSATGVNWNVLAKARSLKNLVPLFSKNYPFYPYEFTSYYSGINRYYSGKQTDGVFKFGGGYVENIGFDTKKPEKTSKSNIYKIKQRENYNRLSIQDIMATSGAAPGFGAMGARSLMSFIKFSTYVSDVATIMLGGTPTPATKKIRKGSQIIKNIASIFPRYNYWAQSKKGITNTKNQDFGDGGFLDNYGVISLLKRDVDNIIVFINSSTPTAYSRAYLDKLNPTEREKLILELKDVRSAKKTKDQVSEDKRKDWRKSLKKINALQIDSQMPCLFGLDHINATNVKGAYTSGTSHKMQVFRSADFAKTVNQIIKNDKEYGLAYCVDTYEVMKNDFWGVPSKKEVNICFVCLQGSHVWESKLGNWKKELKKEDMKGFPNYATFGYSKDIKDELSFKEQGKRVLNIQEMSDKKIFTLSNYTAWVLKEIIKKDIQVKKMFK